MSGKFAVVETDINGIKELLGDSETSPNGSIIDRIYKLEKSSDGTNETISKIKKDFADNKELNELKEAYIDILLNIQIKISQYETDITSYYEDYIITEEEKSYIANAQNDINSFIVKNDEYLNRLTTILEKSNQTYVAIKLNDTNTDFKNALTLLNDTINTEISDNTVSLDDVTIVLNMFGSLNAKFNIYKNTVDENIILGIGGTLTEQITNIKKTSEGIKQSVGEVVKEIDGEDGLKRKVEKNETNILQTAKNLELNYVKNDKILAAISLSEEGIKLDASKILATGTLTWDILDDEAKENLKGESGTAEYIMLIGEQIFKYRDLKELPSPLTINLSAVTSNINTIDSVVWEYKDTSGTWIGIETLIANQLSLSINHNDSYWSDKDSLTIRCTVNDKFKDEMTLVKLYDGINGSDGLDGINGSDGLNAQYVILNGGQLFTYSKEDDIPTPSTIKLTLSKYNIYSSNVMWYYKTSESDSWREITSARGKTEYIVDPSDTTLFPNNSKSVNIKSEIDGFYDEMSIGKIYDGLDGLDPIFSNLTNDSHSIPTDENGNNGNYLGCESQIELFIGNEKITSNVTYSYVLSDGIKGIWDDAVGKYTVTSMSTDSGYIDFTATYMYRVYTKRFTISKNKSGLNGYDAYTINLSNDNHSFPCNDKGYIESEISTTTTITAFKGLEDMNVTIGTLPNIEGLRITSASNIITITALEGSSLSKTGTISIPIIIEGKKIERLFSWTKVENGTDGVDGLDAYYVSLTNSSHTVPCNNKGAYLDSELEKAKTEIFAYKGTKLVPFEVSKVDNGCTSSYNPTTKTLKITSLTENTATVDLTITVEGNQFKKVMTITKSLQGANGQDGIGIQIINSFESESELPSVGQRGDAYIVNGDLYVWADAISSWKNVGRFKGEQGEAGADGKTMYLHIKYSDDGKTFTANKGETLGSWLGQYTDFSPKDSTVFSDYNWSKIKGEDAYTVYLTNENHSFPCESDGTITSNIKVTTDVVVYKGLSEVPFTIGSFPTFNGLSFSKSGGTITITALQGKELSACGSVEFSVIVEGKTFKKSFSWSKSFKGESTEASIPNWIKEWDTNVTVINNSKVVSPRIFAGSVSQGLPTGVALGKNVFGTEGSLGNVNGLIGYKNGKKMYSFDESGNLLIGDKNSNHLSFDGTSFEVVASKIKIGTSPVATESSLSDAISGLEGDLQSQIDGKIQSYSQSNDPSVNWTTEQKKKNIGDLWYNGTETKRWTGSTWVSTRDKSLYDLAQSKKQVFTSTPTIPYYVGDLWVTSTTSNGEIKVCKTTRTSGKYTSSDWVSSLGYIDSNDAKNLVDAGIKDINIGVRNLHRHSDFSREGVLNHWYRYTSTNHTLSIGTYANFGKDLPEDAHIKNQKILRSRIDIAQAITDGATYGGFNLLTNERTITLEANTEYTFSVWFYKGGSCKSCHATIWSENGGNYIAKTEAVTEYTGSFVRKSVTFTTNDSTEYYVRFYNTINLDRTTGNSDVHIYQPLLTKGNKVVSWSEAPEDTVSYIDDAIYSISNDLQSQIDGKIQTYSQTTDPKVSWTSSEYSKHVGDIWYNGQYTYRWSGSSWKKMEDKDAINAGNLASKKAQIFTATPTIPYYKGDLWITNLSGSGVIKTCKTTRTSGKYTSSDWVEGLKYTDDTKVDNLQIGITNLLRYTDFSKSKNIEKWNSYNSTIEQSIYEGFGSNSTKDEFIKGERILRVNMDIAKMISSNATYGAIGATTITLEPNTTYTVSYWAFPTNKLTKMYCNIFNGDASVKYCKTEDIVYNGSFQFVKKTFKTGSDPNCSVRFYGYRDTSLTSGIISFYLYHPKIEKGDKATEWNENPNDSFDNLSDLETALNNKIEGVKGNIEVTDDGIKISINGTNVTVPSHGELETVVTNFNNYITNTANGDFEMVFDKKIAEYDMDGMQTTTKNVKDHILFSNDGSIKLFGSEDKFSLNIGRAKLSFMDGDTEVAYISNQKLLIEDTEVKSSLKIGSFAWVPRENGNTSFTFVG